MTNFNEDNILTQQQLWEFWEDHNTNNHLSTRGLRLLVLHCFNLNEKNTSTWMKRSFENWYEGYPTHPFWIQPDDIQEDILMMLETNKTGRRLVKDYIHNISELYFIGILKLLTVKKSKILGEVP